ncbi:MAG: hypothetical protein ACK44C_01325, partial [Polaromonas sp.]
RQLARLSFATDDIVEGRPFAIQILFLCTVYKPNPCLTSFLFLSRSFKTVLRFPVGLVALCGLSWTRWPWTWP